MRRDVIQLGEPAVSPFSRVLRLFTVIFARHCCKSLACRIAASSGRDAFVLASDRPDAIRPIEITMVDGDTIRARGRTIRLIGFDAPEAGTDARCPRERELGDRATRRSRH